MKTPALLLFLWMALPLAAHCQLEDDNGYPQIPFPGIDTAIIKPERISRVEVLQYRATADTLGTKSGNIVFEAEFDKQARPVFLKGCLHDGTDPCTKEYNLRLFYSFPNRVEAAISIHFDKGKYIYDSTAYSYNDKNKLFESDRFIFVLNSSEDHDTLRGMTTYFYDKKGLLQRKQLAGYTNTVYPKIVYEHDTSGKLLSQSWYDDKGELSETYAHAYDPEGHETRLKEYEEKKLVCTYSNKLDKNGRYIEKKCFDANDSLSLMQTFKYDRHGRLIEIYNEPENQEYGDVTSYKYDARDKLVEKKNTVATGKKIYRYAYFYDKSGKLIEERLFDAEDEISTIYKYKYYAFAK